MNTHLRGITAKVSLAEAEARELVIEFDPQDYPARRPASAAQLGPRIQECTRQAIESGWRPESRGKPFRFTAERLSQ